MPADTDGSWRTPTAVPSLPGTIRDKANRNPIPDTRGLFVIHAIHLYTGKVLWFCGHAEQLDYPLEAYLFDPRRPTAPPVRKPFPGKADLFCCHYVQLADGRILVVGGSQLDHLAGAIYNPATDYRGNAGASTIAIFDPRPGKRGERWVELDAAPKLLQGRWYPTAIVLGDGSVVVVSGRREAPETTWSDAEIATFVRNVGIAEVVEHLRPPSFEPQAITFGGPNDAIPIYPGIHLAPDDRLYTTHTTWGQEIPEPNTLSLTIQPPPSGAPKGTAASGAWTEYVLPTAKAKQPEREEGMSVMLPVVLDPIHKVRDLTSVGKFLVVGGGLAVGASDVALAQREVRDPTPPFATVTKPAGAGPHAFDRQKVATPEPVEILDTSLEGAPRWTPVPGLTWPRVNGHCVLLPDATVLILGGHDAYKWNAKADSALAISNAVPLTNPTLHTEIYTPGVGFHVGAPMTHPRMYHSIAMLLVDGSVIVAGGADPNEHEPSLPFPRTWNGRLYPGTARLVLGQSAGATSLQIDPTPSSYWGPTTGFAQMPAGTKVIVDPGPHQIETTLVALRVHPLTDTSLQHLDIADPLPRDIPDGTRVDFAAAGTGSPIPRVNEWLDTPVIHRKEPFSVPLNRKDYEIYQPPYFHKAGSRPVLPPLKPGQVQVRYGATFTVETPDAARITRVAIMRPGAVTHHTDTEQRFVELAFTTAGTRLSIDMVPGTDSSLVPPGYYMLWILAGSLPCVEARYIQVTGAPKLRSPVVPTEVAPPSSPTDGGTGDGGTGDGGSGGGGADDDALCPLAMAATTTLALAQVTFLRQLRTELAASPAGGGFVALVNRAYYRAGAPLARRLTVRPRWRAAVRIFGLGPLTAAIAAADRLARRRRDGELHRGRLIALLTVVGAIGLLVGPLVAGAAAVHITHARVTRAIGGGDRRWPSPAPSNA